MLTEFLPIAAIISAIASMLLSVSVWTWLRRRGTNWTRRDDG